MIDFRRGGIINIMVIGRGFTLIELLVVIAIIGLLASIVLTSLSGARSKGSDAGIQGNLRSIQTQAELFSLNNGFKYSTDTTVLASAACPTSGNTMFNADATVKSAVTSAVSASGGTLAANTRCAVGPGASSYAVAVQLKSITGWWCTDSSGMSKNTGSATAPALGGSTVIAKCP